MLRTVLGICALVVITATATGCGGVPSGAVATVEGDEIERESFDHWLAVLAKSGGRPDAQVPKPSTKEYATLRDQALQLLISFRWIEGEAEDRDISVAEAEVAKSFEELKERSFPKDTDYRKFLTTSGQTEQDILARVRFNLLSDLIREQVVKGAGTVTEQRTADYYTKNKARFAQPERRDLRVVVTSSRAGALQAKAALAAGGSWASVATRHSIDPTTGKQGGKLPAVADGEQPKALDRAVFSAAEGEITGPDQDTGRVLRLRGHEGPARRAADARAGQARDRAAPGRRRPAGRARGLPRRLPQQVAGEDRVR